jgi:indolepyruvate ferredoxin oxidoreductase
LFADFDTPEGEQLDTVMRSSAQIKTNMTKQKVSLNDRYTQHDGLIHLRGSQAMVRLLLLQRQRDFAAGLNTGGFVSGYRGSPMTAIDEELWRAGALLPENHITFWPGTNEHLAMTSVWGTQQTNYYNDGLYDGVFGMWYGKGPGLDQSIDALRQGNWHGADKHGGVLICVGDDHNMTSTINNYSSELLFQDQFMPVLYPSDIQEVIELGLLGYALSRFCGAWVGFKLLPETIETSATISADIDRTRITLPHFEFPAEGVNAFLTDSVYEQEARIKQYRLPAAIAFSRANALNYVSHDCENPKIGIVSMGKSWRDTLQALQDLGLDQPAMTALGIKILKVGMPFPFDIDTYKEFARGLDTILIIEEKRDLLATGFREACYDIATQERPKLVGRLDCQGRPLLPNDQPITTDHITGALARVIDLGKVSTAQYRLKKLTDAVGRSSTLDPLGLQRIPYFCSGCPHNTSTKIPEGSRGQGGVGCHYMVTWMNRETYTFCQMGGEGITWIGQQPFVKTQHIFQNLGDGTYFHSGSLAVRAAVSAGINITYKLLFNDAVAMTGGQPVDGQLQVDQISHQAFHEGVQRIAVVSDETEKYRSGYQFAPGTTIHHRKTLDTVQREFREIKGVTLIIYDQTCASEKRRRRKRGTHPDPAKRLVINHRVCEGCGDCGVASNCTSIQPLETPFGRKRTIDQSSCNKDYSCVEGFCPSFVTVEGGQLRGKNQASDDWAQLPDAIPHPSFEPLPDSRSFNVLITGVGGTGIVTIGAVLGMAAHIDGIAVSVVDQLGFAQKGGSVVTHIRLAKNREDIHAPRINSAATDTLLACDMLVSGHDKINPVLDTQRTAGVVNTASQFTGDFTQNADLGFPVDTLESRLVSSTKKGALSLLPASQLAVSILGDTLAANLIVTGYAWQKGLLPISREAIHNAIELNGIAVAWNQKAFEWGRALAHKPTLVEELLARDTSAVKFVDVNRAQPLSALLAEELIAYQDQAYAQRFTQWLSKIDQHIDQTIGLNQELSDVIARSLFKLMAYKDEYEVARLHSSPKFLKTLAQQFDGDYRLVFNLAPPLLSRIDKATGRPQKVRFGSWMLHGFKLLATCKKLRNTRFDPFGYTAERRLERQLISDYQRLIEGLVNNLTPDKKDLFSQIAALPLSVRGYGHIKLASIDGYQEQLTNLLEAWSMPIAKTAA